MPLEQFAGNLSSEIIPLQLRHSVRRESCSKSLRLQLGNLSGAEVAEGRAHMCSLTSARRSITREQLELN